MDDFLEKARDLANKVYDEGVKALSKTETERKLAEALSHANWGASSTLMWEIATATNDPNEYQVIMREVWSALAVHKRNWRVIYKGLALLEYLLKNGSQQCLQDAKYQKATIRQLEAFSYQKDGVEKGVGVREKARAVHELLTNSDLLKEERKEAARMRQKLMGVSNDGIQGGYDDAGKLGSDIESDEDNDSDSGRGKKSSSSKTKKSASKKKGKSRKSSSASESGGDDDNDSVDFAISEDDENAPRKPSKNKTKKATKKSSKKHSEEDDDDDDEVDFGFGSPKASKTAAASRPLSDEDDFDAFNSSAPASKPSGKGKPAAAADVEEEDFDAFTGSKPTKSTTAIAAPLKSISIKLPNSKAGSGGGAASSISAPPASSQKQPKQQQQQPKSQEVDLMLGFDAFSDPTPVAAAPATSMGGNGHGFQDWNAFASPAPAPASQPSAMGGFAWPQTTPAPQQQQQQQQPQQFNMPPSFPGMMAPSMQFQHPQMQGGGSFPGTMGGGGGGMMTMGQGGYVQQPNRMMMMPQTTMMPQTMMMPQMNNNNSMMMGMPRGAPSTAGGASMLATPQPAKPPVDAFAGLADFSISGTKKPAATSAATTQGGWSGASLI